MVACEYLSNRMFSRIDYIGIHIEENFTKQQSKKCCHGNIGVWD